MSEIDKYNIESSALVSEISLLIEESKQHVSRVANSSLTLLFWHIGKRINDEILKNERAEYGKQIVPTLSAQLEYRYGRNFEVKNVRRMMQFASDFLDFEIVVPLARQLTWSHFLILIPLKSKEAKFFYANKAIKEVLGKRDLRKQIASKTFERTEIANIQLSNTQPDLMNTFKDPYMLDFLNLKNTYLEQDLEKAILQELEGFILELGKGFAFMERQKRMIIDGDDFYLDLLFYNRTLKRLVAIELKLGKFEASHKGQMELYLKWLNKYEKNEGENEPIGLILCAESNKEQVELLEMHKDGIMVAEYLTVMPPKEELEAKLHQLLVEAKERIERNKRLE
jgi:predicted nuclease of restriction endonuclease-like (RecB) superfamily